MAADTSNVEALLDGLKNTLEVIQDAMREAPNDESRILVQDLMKDCKETQAKLEESASTLVEQGGDAGMRTFERISNALEEFGDVERKFESWVSPSTVMSTAPSPLGATRPHQEPHSLAVDSGARDFPQAPSSAGSHVGDLPGDDSAGGKSGRKKPGRDKKDKKEKKDKKKKDPDDGFGFGGDAFGSSSAPDASGFPASTDDAGGWGAPMGAPEGGAWPASSGGGFGDTTHSFDAAFPDSAAGAPASSSWGAPAGGGLPSGWGMPGSTGSLTSPQTIEAAGTSAPWGGQQTAFPKSESMTSFGGPAWGAEGNATSTRDFAMPSGAGGGSPSFPGNETHPAPPRGSVHATLAINRPFVEVASKADEFKSVFAREIAHAVGVPPHRIRVHGVRASA